MGKYYGYGKYANGYKGTDPTPEDELHYNALKKIWPLRDVAGVFDDDLHVEGKFLDDCYFRGMALFKEFFPDSAVSTINDWMRIFGITTSDEPNNSVVAAWRVIVNKDGRLTPAYYKSVWEAFEFTGVTIHERIEDCFIVAEDYIPLLSDEVSDTGHYISDDGAPWEWEIHCTGGPTNTMIRGQAEALIERLKPAFTKVFFYYDY